MKLNTLITKRDVAASINRTKRFNRSVKKILNRSISKSTPYYSDSLVNCLYRNSIEFSK